MMTGAELKTIRESLNLTTKELADRLGIRSDRTVRYWEQPRSERPIPDGVAEMVLAWDRAVEDSVAMSLRVFKGRTSVRLRRSESGSQPPFDALPHANRLEHAALARLRQRLEELGAHVSIEHV